ncbi:MAG: peptidyl-prolyl cis-trans isomerase, peptidylprolyl isomerase [Candidatus Adlerbacteria bacterium]|nr:peptidyl-prolyl cis-trans isomerase, peptidylprolyl isomerase [Candidatus Adlerbacteria bacterium]
MDKSALAAIAAAVVIFGGGWYFINRGAEPAPLSDLYSIREQEPQQGQTEQAPASTTQQAAVQPISTNEKIMQATLHTTKGDIVIEFSDATPNTVANFTKLASAGFYDGTKFHRVIKDFMIQGGDPLTKDDSMAGRWGTGGPGYQFADEISATNHNAVGTISMANSGPNTNGSQFFINTAENSFLDTKHTVFGHVVSGMEVVAAIEGTPVGAGDRPVEPMVITSVTLK